MDSKGLGTAHGKSARLGVRASRLAPAVALLAATGCGEEFEQPTDGCLAMRFQGEQFVEVPDAAALELTEAFTIELRLYFDEAPGEMHLIAHQDYGAEVGWQLGLYDRNIDFRMYQPSPGQTLWYTEHSAELEAGRWHHVAVVSDGDEVRLFLDGQQIGEQRHPDDPWPADYAGPLRIGAAAYAENFHFTGLIDEARISRGLRYTSDFLVPTEVATADAATVALWHFDEPDGQQVIDETGLHHGTLGPTAGADFSDPHREAGHCLAAIVP